MSTTLESFIAEIEQKTGVKATAGCGTGSPHFYEKNEFANELIFGLINKFGGRLVMWSRVGDSWNRISVTYIFEDKTGLSLDVIRDDDEIKANRRRGKESWFGYESADVDRMLQPVSKLGIYDTRNNESGSLGYVNPD